MPFTPLGGSGDNPGGSYVNPKDQLGHLLLIWPIEYEADTYTQYPRQDGRPSDAVYLDIVDLNLADEDGYAGKVMRRAKWTQGRLIRDTKNSLGVKDPLLVQMGKDRDAYIIVDMSANPQCAQMADQWLAAHPYFVPGADAPARQAPSVAPQQSQHQQWDPRPTSPGGPPMPPPARPVSGAPQGHTNEVMERLRRAAQQNQPAPAAPPLPPPYPGPTAQDEEPPF